MPKGHPNPKPEQPETVESAAEEISIMPPATEKAIEAAKPKTVAMELKRHYRPAGEYEVVGYNRPEKKTKGPDGKERVVEPAAFIPGEPCPAPTPGVGSATKVWATTVIRVSEDEARTMRAAGIAERGFDD